MNNGGRVGSGKIQGPTGKCRLIFSTKESSEEAVLQEDVLTKIFYPEKFLNTPKVTATGKNCICLGCQMVSSSFFFMLSI